MQWRNLFSDAVSKYRLKFETDQSALQRKALSFDCVAASKKVTSVE